MKLICINCPRGCELDVQEKDGKVSVTGHACPRGEAYGVEELTNPSRMVTGLVRVAGRRRPLPVKTLKAVPKSKVIDVINLLVRTTVLPPKRIGDLVVENVCDTGIDIVATSNVG